MGIFIRDRSIHILDDALENVLNRIAARLPEDWSLYIDTISGERPEDYTSKEWDDYCNAHIRVSIRAPTNDPRGPIVFSSLYPVDYLTDADYNIDHTIRGCEAWYKKMLRS